MNKNKAIDYLNDLVDLPKNVNLYIYGTGRSGQSILTLINRERSDINVVGFIDTFKNGTLLGLPVYCCNQIPFGNIDSDQIVLLASYNPTWIAEMIDNLRLIGVNNYKVNGIILDPLYQNVDLGKYVKDIEWMRNRIEPDDKYLWDILIETLSTGSNAKLLEWYIGSKGVQYLDYITLSSGNVVIEGGVFDGEHTRAFSQLVGTSGKVYGFDPFGDQIIRDWSRTGHLTNNISIITKALWSKEERLYFLDDGAGSTVTTTAVPKATEIEATSIDIFASQNKLSRLDMIKLDVEGAEKHVLMGAEQSVKYFKPQMAISIYHSIEHFFELPMIIDKWLPNSRFRLKTYSPTPMDTILYVQP